GEGPDAEQLADDVLGGLERLHDAVGRGGAESMRGPGVPDLVEIVAGAGGQHGDRPEVHLRRLVKHGRVITIDAHAGAGDAVLDAVVEVPLEQLGHAVGDV